MPVGVSICEDLWFPAGPVPAQAAGGARLVVNVNASPYSIGREADRLAVARARVAEAGCAVAYVNQVGGQDELVFDGGSFVMDAVGHGPGRGAEIRRDFAPRRRPGRLTTRPRADAARVSGERRARDGSAARPPPAAAPARARRPRCTRRSCSGRGTI